MFEVGKDYFAHNPQNHGTWNRFPITVFKRTKHYLWIYHARMIEDFSNISDKNCKRVKVYQTNGGYEGIKIGDAYFYSNQIN